MTVQSTTNRTDTIADGVQTVFNYNYLVLDEAHMTVYLDGVLTLSGWTVQGAGNPGGGTVTFSVAPGDQVRVSLVRLVPLTQEIDYTEYDSFPAETHEGGLDLGVMRDQQIQEELDRAVTFAVGDTPTGGSELPAPVPFAAIGYDTDGDLTNLDVGGGVGDVVRTPLQANLETAGWPIVIEDGGENIHGIIDTESMSGPLLMGTTDAVVADRPVTLWGLYTRVRAGGGGAAQLILEDTAPGGGAFVDYKDQVGTPDQRTFRMGVYNGALFAAPKDDSGNTPGQVHSVLDWPWASGLSFSRSDAQVTGRGPGTVAVTQFFIAPTTGLGNLTIEGVDAAASILLGSQLGTPDNRRHTLYHSGQSFDIVPSDDLGAFKTTGTAVRLPMDGGMRVESIATPLVDQGIGALNANELHEANNRVGMVNLGQFVVSGPYLDIVGILDGTFRRYSIDVSALTMTVSATLDAWYLVGAIPDTTAAYAVGYWEYTNTAGAAGGGGSATSMRISGSSNVAYQRDHRVLVDMDNHPTGRRLTASWHGINTVFQPKASVLTAQLPGGGIGTIDGFRIGCSTGTFTAGVADVWGYN